MVRAAARKVTFYRHIQKSRRFQGGHLKVWDYYGHVESASGFLPQIYFSKETVRNEYNPWFESEINELTRWDPADTDLYFLGGKDWLELPSSQRRVKPVINLIQHVRHADSDNSLFQFLKERAVRICVSPEVSERIVATGQVNGPVFTIPNGLNRHVLPASLPRDRRTIPFLIVGFKVPEMALRLADSLALRGIRCECVIQPMPRAEFLALLGRSRAALVLPRSTEGWFLPALEAMVLETPIVCPDCIGNRSFCLDQINCWRPEYRDEAILTAVEEMLAASPEKLKAMGQAAAETVLAHDISVERSRFVEVLSQIDELW